MNSYLLYGCLLPVSAAAWMAVLAGLRRAGFAPEWCRKLFHMGCGVLALTLPWVIASVPAVVALSAFAALMLTGVKCLPSWNRRIGGVLDGVGRGHRGGFYFAAAIGLVFAAAGGDRLRFCLPVAVLTFADASAALVGRRWGRHRFPAGGTCKTLEGSCAFLAVALACTLGCLWAFDGGGPARILSLAVLLSLLLTFVEASAGKGIDNLLIPVVGHLALRIYLESPTAVIAAHLSAAAAAGILVIGAALRRPDAVDSRPWRTACGHTPN